MNATPPPPFLRRRVPMLLAMLLPWPAVSQQTAPQSSIPALAQPTVTAPAANAPAVTAPVVTSLTTTRPAVPVEKGILLNFQNASLTDVLNYLSEAAGFIVVQEAPVAGTVNVVSRQPVSPDEAIDLVNAVLIEKGYIAIRNGRILKIVSRRGAQMRDLPVEVGSDPTKIPRKDDMVTQILPLRFGEAAKLMDNIRPLLSENATISANESSNAIILTDTQTNVRRVAQIIQAVDTSVSAISTIKVFPLTFADAKQVATLVTSLFANNTTGGGAAQGRGGRGGGGRGGFGGFGGFGGAGGFPGGGGQGGQAPSTAGQSEARQAASRVVAVADEQSNSLIVSAPDEVMPTIKEIIVQIDTSITDVTENKIFRLEHADAVEMAALLTTLYPDPSAAANRNRGQPGFGGFGGFGGGQPGAQGANSTQSQRTLLQSKVVAVGDPRTNSLLVTAARDSMTEIALMVGRLDATDAKKQRVYVHQLENVDPDAVATVLRGMLGDNTGSASQNTQSTLNRRSQDGAAIDAASVLGGGGGGGGGGGAGRR